MDERNERPGSVHGEEPEAHERLAFLERRYRSLFQEAPVMYVITRAVGGTPVIEDCNQLFLETLGFDLEEVLQRPLGDFYTPDSRADLMEGGGYQQALDGSFAAQERRLVTKTGTVVETLLRAVPVTDEDGELVGTRAMYVDITERKEAEEALRRSETKYRTLFEDSPDAIFVSTPDGRLLDINRAGVELFGFDSREEILKVDVKKAFYSDASERERMMEELAERGFIKDFELRLRKKDGSALVVLETTSAVRDPGGQVVAYQGIIRDVTHQRVLEEKLRRAERMEAIGQLAGGVAHDFNNLLTAILGYTELGLKACGSEAALGRYLEEIMAAGQRAAELTRQLLAFARRQVLRPQVLDLNAVVAGVDRLLRRTIGENIELVTRLDPDLAAVRADPGQVEQILVNLAVNARDAMPAGGTLAIETANAFLDEANAPGDLNVRPGLYVMLSVRDTGSGMDEETRRRIFEPFFTTKEPGKGTGLGLATAYGIVKQSDGYVWVDSRPEAGSDFKILLPRVDEPPEPIRAPRGAAKTAGGMETILLVEDEAMVSKLTSTILEELGYRVLTAEDPEGALRLAAEHRGPIDLLLTDVVLRGMTGLELAREVSARRPETRVLSMSGYTFEAAFGAPLGSEVPFIGKPFHPESLAKKVREVLDS